MQVPLTAMIMKFMLWSLTTHSCQAASHGLHGLFMHYSAVVSQELNRNSSLLGTNAVGKCKSVEIDIVARDLLTSLLLLLDNG